MKWNRVKQALNEVEQLTRSVVCLCGYIACLGSMHVRSHLIIDSTPGANYWLCCKVFKTQLSLKLS